ncbi:MAG: DUF2934 domain-containing protein [Kiritimatiellae bacterium]|nr:DUF2934 domain-containing protein [Kiritimatiellia bacterium]MDD4736048.1 DUF2934 domain-containing protein [Kiritimatiellia bacterium]
MAKTVKSTVKKETKTKKPVAAKKAPAVKSVAAKKAPVKKVVAKKSAAAAPAKRAPAASKVTTRKKVVTAEERFRMVNEAAYYVAERNGFAGDDQRYWAEAEASIDALVVTK